MAEELDGMDRIAESVRDSVRQYASQVCGLAADNLAA